MIINNGPIGGKFNPLKDLKFSFSIVENDNSSNYEDVLLEIAEQKKICSFIKNDNKWELKILQNCNIKFTKQAKNIIVFMVGGGDGGNCGSAGFSSAHDSLGRPTYYEHDGGQGGNGGKSIQTLFSFNRNIFYKFNIGEGGKGGYFTDNSGEEYYDGAWHTYYQYDAQSPTSGGDSSIKLLNDEIKITTNNGIQTNGGIGAYIQGGSYYDPSGTTPNTHSHPNIQIIAEKGTDGVKFHGKTYGSSGGGGKNYSNSWRFKGEVGGEGGGNGMGYVSTLNDIQDLLDDYKNSPESSEKFERYNQYINDETSYNITKVGHNFTCILKEGDTEIDGQPINVNSIYSSYLFVNGASNKATNGMDNTGGGGGGGSIDWTNNYDKWEKTSYDNCGGGNGGSGIIILSNYNNE